ncbi:MAG: glycoside hydrolase family 3 N-terminal domain-containing protein [Pseudomonadota bacterium]
MAAGAYILAPSTTSLRPEEAAFFRQADPWGFILFARNVDTPEQLRRLTGDLRAAVGRDAPIFIDQEGGRVQRMTPPIWRQWTPPMDDCVRSGDNAARAIALRYQIIAEELRQAGIDGNCVPCLDLAFETTHPFLKNRCYGSDPEEVAAIGRAAAEACLAAGILPVIKHMPGHGRSETDSHEALPRVKATAETLQNKDFIPFRELADFPLGMTGHLVFEAFDAAPATLSKTMIDLIRNEIGFTGLLMTDDISMGALTGPMAERCSTSIAAGCDLVLHCNGEMGEMEAVAEATGRLEGVAKDRANAAMTARGRGPAQGDVDIEALMALFEQIMEGGSDA